MNSLVLLIFFQTPIDFRFTDVTIPAGLETVHGFATQDPTEPQKISGGVAVGDYNNDGFPDLYVIVGSGPNKLFRNRGDGTFEDQAQQAGATLEDLMGSGPLFADVNGDGWQDLFVGGLQGTGPRLLINRGNGSFVDQTALSGLVLERDTIAAAFGDYDLDGDLDLFLTHWSVNTPTAGGHLWRNMGNATFECVDEAAGITGYALEDFSFTPNFADINSNGYPDLLITGDFGTSKIFINQGDGTFQQDTQQELTDENGMGGAVGDFNNDGHLDWFVSSIWDPNQNGEQQWTGNRLYQNNGMGQFTDVSVSTDVRKGYWGWGASFADFNGDGFLDIFQTNGWFGPLAEIFEQDPSRLFLSSGKGYFVERSGQMGLEDDRGQGRGVVCFDYDRDGDPDIFVANSFGKSSLYRNEPQVPRSWLSVQLKEDSSNSQGVGARVYLSSGQSTQMRELRAGSNFVSQNPIEARFGAPQPIDNLTIRWPDGETRMYHDLEPNRNLTISRQPQHLIYLPINPLKLTQQAWLTLIHPGAGEATSVVTAINESGGITRRSLPYIPSGGCTQFALHNLPGSFNWIRVESTHALQAVVTGRNPKGAFAIPATSRLQDKLITPHIAANTDIFQTYANFINGTERTILPHLSTADGAVWDLNLTTPLSAQFLNFETFWNGNIGPQRTTALVASPTASLAGAEVFGYKNQTGMAGLTLTGNTSTQLIFSHIADVSRGWWTGIVVVNPGNKSATLQITAYADNGVVLKNTETLLPAGAKITALIDPNHSGQTLISDGFPTGAAWVEVKSSFPITGYELFGTVSGNLFAALEAGTQFVEEFLLPYSGDANHFAGLALVSRNSGVMEISLISPDGQTLASSTRETTAGARFLTLATDIFPQVHSQGYLRVKSDAGIHGFQLHGPHTGAWLVGLNSLPLND